MLSSVRCFRVLNSKVISCAKAIVEMTRKLSSSMVSISCIADQMSLFLSEAA